MTKIRIKVHSRANGIDKRAHTLRGRFTRRVKGGERGRCGGGLCRGWCRGKGQENEGGRGGYRYYVVLRVDI